MLNFTASGLTCTSGPACVSVLDCASGLDWPVGPVGSAEPVGPAEFDGRLRGCCTGSRAVVGFLLSHGDGVVFGLGGWLVGPLVTTVAGSVEAAVVGSPAGAEVLELGFGDELGVGDGDTESLGVGVGVGVTDWIDPIDGDFEPLVLRFLLVLQLGEVDGPGKRTPLLADPLSPELAWPPPSPEPPEPWPPFGEWAEFELLGKITCWALIAT